MIKLEIIVNFIHCAKLQVIRYSRAGTDHKKVMISQGQIGLIEHNYI